MNKLVNIMNGSNPTPYQLLLWYKTKEVSKILGLDERFMLPRFNPVFKTQYASAIRGYRCIVTWDREIFDERDQTKYTPAFYKEYDYFYGFKENTNENSRRLEEKFNQFSEFELLSYFFGIRERIIEGEKNRIQAIKDVQEHNLKELDQYIKSERLKVFGVNFAALGMLTGLFLTPQFVLLPVVTSAYSTYEICKDTRNKLSRGIVESNHWIKESEYDLKVALSGKIAKEVFIDIFSGDDWVYKVEVYRKKTDLLDQVKATNYL